MQYRKTFNYSEFLTHVQSKAESDEWPHEQRSQLTDDSNFKGSRTFKDAIELATYGWQVGLDAMKGLPELTDSQKSLLPNRELHYFGSSVNVPQFLVGNEKHMNRSIRTDTIPTLHIIVNVGVAYTVNSHSIINRGKGVVSAIKEYEKLGVNCKLTVIHVSQSAENENYVYQFSVTVKEYDQELDIDRAAFCFAHPSFLRRLMLKCLENTGSKLTGSRNNYFEGYGYPVSNESKIDIPKNQDSEKVLFINTFNKYDTNYSSYDSALEHILRLIKKQLK